MSNIHGLGSVRDKDKDKNKDMEEFSSVGGTSATNVMRPAKGTNRDNASPSPSPSSSSTSSSSSSSSSSAKPTNNVAADIIAKAKANAAASSSSSASANAPDVGVITVYANGFTIGQEFRDSSLPQNKKFLEAIRNGDVPAELEETCVREWGPNVSQVRISLVDKSTETYTPPKPKFDFAKSQGQATGSNIPSGSGVTSFASCSPGLMTVNESKPKTTLQLVLHPRQRLKLEVNQDATVAQLYSHIMTLSGLAGFELLAGFPPKPLTNPALTIKDAGLCGASVQQRA